MNEELHINLTINLNILSTLPIQRYMRLSTNIPKAMPRNVAMEIPKIPTRRPGTTKEVHPLAVAIPHAVVGPPMFAFDAMSNSFRSNRKSFPNPRITSKWTLI